MLLSRVGLISIALGLFSMAAQAQNTGKSADTHASANQKVHAAKTIDLKKLPTDLDQLFPLSPQEKVEIRERQLEDQNATYQPLRKVTPIREMVRITKQAAKIPKVYVTPDYPSSVVFTDLMGRPWPIDYVAQTSSLVETEQPKGTVGALVLHAHNGAGQKSISVYLKGMLLPVTLTLIGSNTKYHALKNIRIEARGPESKNVSVIGGPGTPEAKAAESEKTKSGHSLDEVINKLAYNVTPKGFEKLNVSDPTVNAWIDKADPSSLYVMTDYDIVSPAPEDGGRSVIALEDNLRVYVLPRINPVMALNKDGERIYLSFKEPAR